MFETSSMHLQIWTIRFYIHTYHNECETQFFIRFFLDTQFIVYYDDIKLDKIFNIDDSIECLIYKWKRISIFYDDCV